jgi:hypothetical protein
LPRKILEWEPEGTRRRGKQKERWIDGVRRSMTNHGLAEEDTRNRDRWWNLVMVKENHCRVDKPLDDDDDDDEDLNVKFYMFRQKRPSSGNIQCILKY